MPRTSGMLEHGKQPQEVWRRLGAISTHASCLPTCHSQCWVFSACIALIVATTSYVARRSSLPPDWEVAELVSAANSQPPAVAAMLRAAATPAPGGRPTVAPPCTLPPEAWELGLPASESDTGGAGDVALDLGSLCGQAITPGSLSMLQAGGEQQPSG